MSRFDLWLAIRMAGADSATRSAVLHRHPPAEERRHDPVEGPGEVERARFPRRAQGDVEEAAERRRRRTRAPPTTQARTKWTRATALRSGPLTPRTLLARRPGPRRREDRRAGVGGELAAAPPRATARTRLDERPSRSPGPRPAVGTGGRTRSRTVPGRTAQRGASMTAESGLDGDGQDRELRAEGEVEDPLLERQHLGVHVAVPLGGHPDGDADRLRRLRPPRGSPPSPRRPMLRSIRTFPVAVQSQPKSGIRSSSFFPMAIAPRGKISAVGRRRRGSTGGGP